jgi:glycosyltransferase involved in cell wall biosynthesis
MNKGKVTLTGLSFKARLKARLVGLMMALFFQRGRHGLGRWHENCQKTLRRMVLKVMYWLFPGQRSALEHLAKAVQQGQQSGAMTGGLIPVGAQRWPVYFAVLAARAVPEFGPSWLHVERSNLVEVARHFGVGWVDWQFLPVVRDDTSRAATPHFDALLAQLATIRVSHIFFLPWLQPGGADKVALAYLKVLDKICHERVLLITTENVDSPWLEFVPPGTQIIEWAKLEQWSDTESSLNGLLRLIATVRPSVLHVINSYLGWQLLSRHGLRLQALSRLYVSLFWYGPSKPGFLLGYAAEFLPLTYRFLDGILTDNRTFADRLCMDYGYDAAKFHRACHPTDFILDDAALGPPPQAAARVIWASRFAPEKKLEVLALIAERLPLVEFHVFGDASNLPAGLMPAVRTLKALPNVRLRGAHDGFETIALEGFNLFLYTSSSDGMPMVVVEALAHGLPVVAPAVGGIAELIDAETGWLINCYDDCDAYIAAIEEILGNPNEAMRRCRNGLTRVRERHTEQAFIEQLKRVPGYLSQ